MVDVVITHREKRTHHRFVGLEKYFVQPIGQGVPYGRSKKSTPKIIHVVEGLIAFQSAVDTKVQIRAKRITAFSPSVAPEIISFSAEMVEIILLVFCGQSEISLA